MTLQWVGPQAIWGVSLTIIAFLWFSVAQIINSEQTAIERDARQQAGNITRLLEEHIATVVRTIDYSLITARELYARDPAHFDLAHWWNIGRHLPGLPYRVVIIDRDGYALMNHTGAEGLKERVNLSDREHFQVHKLRDDDELFISRPTNGRIDNKLWLFLSRRIRAADGAFAGVVVAALDPADLLRFYETIDVGRRGVVTLLGTDGIVRARSPATAAGVDQPAIGTSLRGSKLFQALAQASAGNYNTKSVVDGVERLYTYRKVDGLPLVVVVGQAHEELYADFDRSRIEHLVAAFTLTGVFVLLGSLAHLYLKGLRQREKQYRTVVNGVQEILFQTDEKGRLTFVNSRWDTIFGRAAADSLGRELTAFLHPDDRARCAQKLGALRRGEIDVLSDEFRAVDANGAIRWLALNARMMPQDEGARSLFGTFIDVTARREAQAQAAEAHRELVLRQQALDEAVIVAVTDVKGRIISVNDKFCAISGYTREELIGKNPRIFSSGLHSKQFFRAMFRQIARGQIWRGQICNKTKDGRLYWVDTTIVPQLGPNNKPVRYMAIRIDITAQKEAEEALRASQELAAQKSLQLETALANMPHGLCMFDAAHRVVVANEQYARLYGLTLDDVKPGTPLQEIAERRIARGLYAGNTPEQYRRSVLETAGRPGHMMRELTDGRAILVINKPMANGGWVSIHQDITEQRRVQRKIMHMAFHDPLTGLANRTLFLQETTRACARLATRGERFSILMLDLDHFKEVNDTFGHAIGDALLQVVANRLRANVRETDVVARLGGDEFAILQGVTASQEADQDQDQQDEAIALAQRLVAEVSAPYSIEGHQLVIGTSIGIALAPRDGAETEALLKRADLALYKVKANGRNGFRLFEPEMEREASSNYALERDLRKAIAKGELEVHYQPIVDAATREICALEALVRWRHPEQGLLAPAKFMSLAEETGLIVPIGEMVLRKVCADAVTFPSPLKVSVNLSPVQFARGNLVDTIATALSESGLPAERLELEITETVLLEGNDTNRSILNMLRSLGISIALDDFGTGYASLRYLHMFRFDKIKIDRSFVTELSNNADCGAIICAITGLARMLGIITTAEGVETEEQYQLLRAAGCNQMQGYLFGAPRPASALVFRQEHEKTSGDTASDTGCAAATHGGSHTEDEIQ